MNSAIFREYDIRGVAGKDITTSVAYDIGRALAAWLRELGHTRALLGRDNRHSSPGLAEAACRGLCESGVEVLDLGLVITPMFYFGLRHLDVPGGLMVTASHNPKDQNGFKVALGEGTLYGAAILELKARIEAQRFQRGRATHTQVDIWPDYLADMRARVNLGGRHPKVVVDCGHGTASLFAPTLLRTLGAQVSELYCTSDPDFPAHHPDPVKPKNLVDLGEAVRAEGADAGLAFDGDGDRLGAVDDSGAPVSGDVLLTLFWREILQHHSGADALIEVKCSNALVDEVRRLGGKPQFTRTGHSLVKARMREIGAPFAGELSGHFFFADEFYGYDDALYAAGRLLRLMGEKRLGDLRSTVRELPSTPEVRLHCPDERKQHVVTALKETLAQSASIVDIDGVRAQFDDGWVLCRASNTGPELVLRAEGESDEALVRLTGLLEAALSDVLGERVSMEG